MRMAVLSFFAFFSMLEAYEFHDLDYLDQRVTKKQIEKRLTFLVKDRQLEAYYSLTDQCFSLHASLEDKLLNKVEYSLALASDEVSKPQIKKDLKGVKIALDPGHIGGKWKAYEKRFIALIDPDTQKKLSFNEPQMAYQVAEILKGLLEEKGAEVLITKKGEDAAVYEWDFKQWLAMAHPQAEEDSYAAFFRTEYNVLDMQARADKINAFRPDLCLIIHFNADIPTSSELGKQGFAEDNYSLVFVPGAFMIGELNTSAKRVEFARLALTCDLEESISFSEICLKNLVEDLGVPALVDSPLAPTYITKASIQIEPGVYARNLFMARMVHSPLCYGEALIQNHLEEARKLSSLEEEGSSCSARVRLVAKSYFNSIVQYFCN